MIKASAQNIWMVSEDEKPPVLTAEMVSAFEAEIGLKLPEALLDLLAVQNGGYLRFEHPVIITEMIFGIGPQAWAGALFRMDQEDHGGPLPVPVHELLAIAGDGHWYLCLDYRLHPAEPAVTYLDIEGDYSEYPIAPSFQAFLDQLWPKVEDVYILEPDWPLEEVMTLLEERLKTTFRAPVIWLDRPRTLRAKYRHQDQNQWLAISPNEVMEAHGVRIRYPSLKPDCYLLELEPDACERVLGILEDQGIEVRHLREYPGVLS